MVTIHMQRRWRWFGHLNIEERCIRHHWKHSALVTREENEREGDQKRHGAGQERKGFNKTICVKICNFVYILFVSMAIVKFPLPFFNFCHSSFSPGRFLLKIDLGKV